MDKKVKNRPRSPQFVQIVMDENETLRKRLDHLIDQVRRSIKLSEDGFSAYVPDRLKQALADIEKIA